ncbi:MAG: hypothetical protein WCT19_04640, partial [Candidatus Paceibacterota bacterium]
SVRRLSYAKRETGFDFFLFFRAPQILQENGKARFSFCYRRSAFFVVFCLSTHLYYNTIVY